MAAVIPPVYPLEDNRTPAQLGYSERSNRVDQVKDAFHGCCVWDYDDWGPKQQFVTHKNAKDSHVFRFSYLETPFFNDVVLPELLKFVSKTWPGSRIKETLDMYGYQELIITWQPTFLHTKKEIEGFWEDD